MIKYLLFILSFFLLTCDSDVEGCTNIEAYNYNPNATTDNGSCLYCEDLENEEDCLAQGYSVQRNGYICEWHGHDDHGHCRAVDHNDEDSSFVIVSLQDTDAVAIVGATSLEIQQQVSVNLNSTDCSQL